MSVRIIWSWEDVQEIRPDWSEDRCIEALNAAERPLVDSSIELGWEVLEYVLSDQEDRDG